MSPKASRSELIAALERGDASALEQPVELVLRTQALLGTDDPAGAEGLPEALLALVAFHAVEHGRAEFLARALSGPKALARLVKKELYRLKSEGRTLQLPNQASEVKPSRTEPQEALPAFVTPVDIDGRRGFICAHVDPAEGFEAFMGELSDTLGLIRLDASKLPRRDFRKLARELTQPTGGAPPWMEVSPSKLGAFLAEARARNEARGDRPSGLMLITRLFPGTPQAPESASWPAPDRTEESSRVHHSAKLFAEVEFSRWMPSNEALAALTQRIDEVATSRIVVDEQQRRAQIEAALDRTVDEFFNAEERQRYADRLFAQADYFEATGRSTVAQLAAATARALRGDAQASSIPFARAFFQKALLEQTEAAMARLPRHARERLAQEQAEPKTKPTATSESEAPSGLIIPGR